MTRITVVFFLVLMSCGRDRELPPPPVDEGKLGDQFAEANRMLAVREDEQMDLYARNRKLAFVKTPSGIRYHVYQSASEGDSITPGMQVTMDYTLSLLDGTVAYTSDSLGRRSFIVGHDDVESGLHRGIQYLKRGDKALLIIPSALAHGLLGDLNRIPPHMPIVYHVKVY